MNKRIAKNIFIWEGEGQTFEPRSFCRCTNKKCRNLYEITEDEVIKACLCDNGHPLISKKQFHKLVEKNNRTSLALIKALIKSRNEISACRTCGIKISKSQWICPFCDSKLPQRETRVWVLTGRGHNT